MRLRDDRAEFRAYAPRDDREPAAHDRAPTIRACSRRWARCRASASCRPERLALAYADALVPLKPGPRPQQPDGARPAAHRGARRSRGERALVVGAATGYAAAVLARLVGPVRRGRGGCRARRRRPRRPRRLPRSRLVEGPLAKGWKAGAPYDLILIDGAVETVPDALIAQLAEGGRLAAGLARKRGHPACHRPPGGRRVWNGGLCRRGGGDPAGLRQAAGVQILRVELRQCGEG